MFDKWLIGEEAFKVKKEGKKVRWLEKAHDRDGWEYDREVEGYEYNGKRYIVKYDRDGWLEAFEI